MCDSESVMMGQEEKQLSLDDLERVEVKIMCRMLRMLGHREKMKDSIYPNVWLCVN